MSMMCRSSSVTNNPTDETTDAKQNLSSVECDEQCRENDGTNNPDVIIDVCPFENVVPLHCVCATCCGCNVVSPIFSECMVYAERYCKHSDYFSHVCSECDYIQRFVK